MSDTYNGPVLSIGIKDIAKATNISYAQWYKFCSLGLIPHLKLGTRKIVVRVSVVEEFLKINEGRDLMDIDNLKAVSKCTV